MFIFASCGCFIVGVDAGIGKGLDEQINQQVLQMQAKPLAEKLAKQDLFVEQLIAKAQMGLGEQMGDGEVTDEQVDRLILVYAVAMVQQQPKQAQEMLDMSDEELTNELGEGLMKTFGQMPQQVKEQMWSTLLPKNMKPDDKLFLAARLGHATEAIAAVNNGADVDKQHEQKRTPLMEATLGGHANIVQFLLQRGANAYISEKDGYTPVHGAAFQGRREIMQLLMDHGVDPSDVRRHADGFDPAHRICWAKGTPSPNQDFPGTLEVLIKAGYEAVNLLRTAPCVVRERTDAIRQLVQEYTDEETFEKAFDHFQYPGAYQEELGEKKAKNAKKAKKVKKKAADSFEEASAAHDEL